MKNITLLLLTSVITILLSSCKSTSTISNTNLNGNRIVTTAKKYLGTPYKWAGTTKNGMDCSGLVYTTFLENDYKLPRVSKDQAKTGQFISIKKTVPGDLVFFKTDNSSKINHVGIVVENNKSIVKFIHSSSSKGVIISSVNEIYWKRNYQHAKRLIKNKNHKPSKNAKRYKVTTGDTLYSISKKFNTTVEKLKKENHLKSNNIDVGMLLKVN